MLDALRLQASHSTNRILGLFAYPADPASAARLQEEQFAALRQNTPGMMAANIGNALALLATFIDTPLAARAMIWTDALLLFCIYIYLRARRRGPARRERSKPTRIGRRAVFNAVVLGFLWAAVPLLFFLDASPGARLMVISLTSGMLFGGAFALARAPLAATVFAAPITIGAGATLIRGDDPDLLRIAIVLCIYVAVLLRGVYAEASNFRDRVLSQMGAEREARTDPLTGLPNRLAFTDAMERELAHGRRCGGGTMLLLVDIDNFKTINDRFGHPAGDELLAQAARRMRASLRASDVVARLGGDEFAIVATDVTTDAAAELLAERVVACYDEPFQLEGCAIQGAASVGGALAPRDGADQRALFKSADLALYRAKEQGGGWRLFQRAEDLEEIEAHLLEQELRRGLSLDQFSLAFQPIVGLARNDVVGCEALLRWRHPTCGDASPAIFIPLLEKLGLIHEIGLWVVEAACAAAARFPDDFRVCVNVSAVQLCRPDFAERALEAVARAQIAPRRLEIEITEKSMLGDDQCADAEVLKFSRAGMTVSLDDFGSGFSSLAHFCKMPLDRVKIDGPLVREMLARKDCAAIVAGVTRMAKGFHIGVVAEGVETMAQFERLREIGVAEAQGYLIAAPMPLERLEAFVAEWNPERLASAPEPLQKHA